MSSLLKMPYGIKWAGTSEELDSFLNSVWAACEDSYKMQCGSQAKCDLCQLMNSQDELDRLIHYRRYLRKIHQDAASRVGSETIE